jgi:hypothetical protein
MKREVYRFQPADIIEAPYSGATYMILKHGESNGYLTYLVLVIRPGLVDIAAGGTSIFYADNTDMYKKVG